MALQGLQSCRSQACNSTYLIFNKGTQHAAQSLMLFGWIKQRFKSILMTGKGSYQASSLDGTRAKREHHGSICSMRVMSIPQRRKCSEKKMAHADHVKSKSSHRPVDRPQTGWQADASTDCMTTTYRLHSRLPSHTNQNHPCLS